MSRCWNQTKLTILCQHSIMQPHLENPRAFSCDRQRQALITMETPCIRTLKHHEVFPVWLDSYIVSDTSYRFFLFKLHKFPPIRHLITSDWQWQCITQLGYSLCCWLLLKNSQLHRNRDHFLRIRDVTEQVFKKRDIRGFKRPSDSPVIY